MIDFDLISGFDWDEGNIYKNQEKHNVSTEEAEQVFSNEPLLLSQDAKHSQTEERYLALGKTNSGRLLSLAFTLRESQTLIRLISARPMDRKERYEYDQET